jgi:D-alanine-D-alanine ligase-like ATP-grasp enzyme
MYYPDQARYAQMAAGELGFEFLDLDENNGYLFAISDGRNRVLSGAGWICSYPINNAASYGISRDKAHTKAVLRASGIKVIHGNHFFVSTSYSALRNPGHEIGDAYLFAAQIGYPVFCKPNHGARGDYAERITDEPSLRGYVNRLPLVYDAFLIEQVVQGDEYRVMLQDCRPIYYALKRPPHLIGNGVDDISRLLTSVNLSLIGTGVSSSPISAATATGLSLAYVPLLGEKIPLIGRQNLSALGGIDRLETNIPEPLYKIAAACCTAIGIRLGAVDVFDTSAKGDLSELVVIEVNGNPTLKALEQAGRLDIIVTIWKEMLIELLGS